MAKGKRKSNQRKDRNKIESIDNFNGDIFSKLIVAVSVICFIFAFYLLTVHITNKNTNKDKKDEKEEVIISNDNIMVGRSLSISDDDYLVIFYDKSNEEINGIYSPLYTNYKYSGNSKKIYSVDMSNGFNKKFATDKESNKNPESSKDFKINGPTLILVSNHTVVDYIEGEEAIKEYLDS